MFFFFNILYYYNTAPDSSHLSNITVVYGASTFGAFSNNAPTVYYHVNANHQVENAYFKDVSSVNNHGQYGNNITYENIGSVANTIIDDTSVGLNTLILKGYVQDNTGFNLAKLNYQIKGYEVLDLSKASNSAFSFNEEELFKIANTAEHKTLEIHTRDINAFHLLDSGGYNYTYDSLAHTYDITDTTSGNITQIILKHKT